MNTKIWKIPKLFLAATVLFYTSGSFAAGYYLPSASFKLDGENPHYGVIGDFNADDTDDLAAVFPIPDNVTGAITSTRINFLVGNRDGTMKLETSFSLPFNVLSMATGDFDGDGEPDLAVAQAKANGISDPYCGTQQGIVIFFGQHNETQPDLQFGACMLDTPAAELSTVDANADNLADLIVGDQLFLGNGDGSFTPGDAVPAGDKVIADINGDNNPDVYTDDEAVCGDGSGGMISCPLPPNDPLVDTDFQGNIPYQSYQAVLPVSQQASADIDGDGIGELIGAAVTALEYPVLTSYRKCGWTTAVVNVYRPGAGRGRSRTGGSYYRRSRPIYRCWTSSYYSTGATTVTTTSGIPIPERSALRISLVHSDGSVEQMMGPEIEGYIRSLQVADINEDGHPDILADIAKVGNSQYNLGTLYSNTDWKVFTGNGDGTFNLPAATELPLNAVIPGDFNGDGLTDFGAYVTPFDSEHLFSVAFHNPPLVPLTPEPAPNPEPAPIPETAPTPEPASTPTTAQPTGNQTEFSGTVTEIGTDYFVIDGDMKVSIGTASVLNYEDGFGPTPKVGDPVEGKADEYSNGSYVAVKAQFG